MLEVKIARKTAVAQDTSEFELVAVDGVPLPAFAAGAHIDVQIAPGLVRQYSLCNDPSEQHRYVIGVLREENSRGGSSAMHDAIHTGDFVSISEPRNLFPVAEGPHNSLLLAGGIGITPLLAMAESLSGANALFTLHYCCRTRARAAFSDRIVASPYADRVTFHFDDEDAEQSLQVGALLAGQDRSTHLYVCGPTGFIEHVLSSARANGWSDANLHYEFFTAQSHAEDGDGAFDVRLAKSGRTITIPGNQTVVQALADAGVAVEISCEQGVCGTCITAVLEGEPDHRDSYFTAAEQALNNQFTPCCSRSKTPVLVLDL